MNAPHRIDVHQYVVPPSTWRNCPPMGRPFRPVTPIWSPESDREHGDLPALFFPRLWTVSSVKRPSSTWGLPAIDPDDVSGGARGEQDDRERDSFPALFSPSVWTVSCIPGGRFVSSRLAHH